MMQRARLVEAPLRRVFSLARAHPRPLCANAAPPPHRPLIRTPLAPLALVGAGAWLASDGDRREALQSPEYVWAHMHSALRAARLATCCVRIGLDYRLEMRRTADAQLQFELDHLERQHNEAQRTAGLAEQARVLAASKADAARKDPAASRAAAAAAAAAAEYAATTRDEAMVTSATCLFCPVPHLTHPHHQFFPYTAHTSHSSIPFLNYELTN